MAETRATKGLGGRQEREPAVERALFSVGVERGPDGELVDQLFTDYAS